MTKIKINFLFQTKSDVLGSCWLCKLVRFNAGTKMMNLFTILRNLCMLLILGWSQ